jgi:hypothetical protein
LTAAQDISVPKVPFQGTLRFSTVVNTSVAIPEPGEDAVWFLDHRPRKVPTPWPAPSKRPSQIAFQGGDTNAVEMLINHGGHRAGDGCPRL